MRGVIFGLVVSFMIILVSGSVAAEVNCSDSDINKTRIVQFLNGCGSYSEICNHYPSCAELNIPADQCNKGAIRRKVGNFWEPISKYVADLYNLPYTGISVGKVCMSNSSGNPCCASPCGYKSEPYEDCRTCNDNYGYIPGGNKPYIPANGTSYALPDYAACSFTKGFCFSATCDSIVPTYLDNQNDINLSDKNSKVALNFSFFDNYLLGKFDMSVCMENSSNCSSEFTNLTGQNVTEPLGMPRNILIWIDERANGSQTFIANITLYDKGGLSSTSVNSFKITGEDLPVITVDPISDLEFGDRANIDVEVYDLLSETKTIEIMIDDILSESCDNSMCSYEYVPSSGTHVYKVYVEDNAGNKAETSGAFYVAGKKKSCSEIGGVICNETEECENNQYTSTTDSEVCCTSSCYIKTAVEPTGKNCSSQNGIMYDSSSKDCSLQLTATDVGGINKCCGVQPTTKVEAKEKNVYWVDSVGNRIFGVWLQEDVKCVTTGNVKQMQIIKNGEIKVDKAESRLSMKVNEIGEYVCRALYSDGTEKESLLRVAELPAISDEDKAKLPGFGWIQFMIAITLVILYGLMRRK